MKRIITRIMMIMTMITSVSNFSFAATTGEIAAEEAYCQTQTSICGTAPAEFTALLDFTREMMNSIKTIGTEGNYLGKYVNPNRFKGNVFAPPPQTAISRLERNVTQKLNFGVATAGIFGDIKHLGGSVDVLGGTALLAKNKVFLRDTKLVEDLESLLASKKLELGLGGGSYAQVNPENLKIMQTIIKKYIDKGIFTDSSQLKNGVLYNNITAMLTNILFSLKDFLSFGSIDQPQSYSLNNSNSIIIIVHQDALSTIDRNYACVGSPSQICSTQSKKIGQMVVIIKKSVTDTKAAWKIITDARKRLGQTFSPSQQDDQFKARENDLLRSMYGTTTFSTGKFINASVTESNGSVKDLARVGTGIAAGLTTVAKFFFVPKNLKETKDYVTAPNTPNTTQTSYAPGENAFTSLMNDYIADVFASQKADSELADFVEVKGITPAFTVLGKQITSIKNDVLGGKNKESSLIWSLGKACELQCGGGGKCRGK